MRIEVDGATLNVEVEGDREAPAVLFWNGGGCTLRMWDLIVERPAGWNEHANPDSVRPAMRAIFQGFDVAAAAGALAMKTPVATEDHDPKLPSSRDLAAMAPDAELIVMENVGHGSVLQRPDLATEIFTDFVAANTSTPAQAVK